MKSPEFSHEQPRRAPLAGPIEPGPGRSDEREDRDFQPRFLDLPPRRTRGSGGRNLAWGVGLLVVSLGLLAWAIFLSGPRALLALGVALVTLVTLYVLARSRLFRQRNGGFLALAVVCLVGVLAALAERGWHAVTETVRRETMQRATVQSEPAASPVAVAPPLLTERFRISPPEAGSGPNVRVLRDSRVPIAGKIYLIKAGEIFALAGTSNGEVRFAAGEREIALPADVVEIIGTQLPATATASPAPVPAPDPMPISPTELTAWAQREAVRRYPALGAKNSAANQMFIDTYQDLKLSGVTEIFNHADWPLRLAESLADSQGWPRADFPPEPAGESPEALAPEAPEAPAPADPVLHDPLPLPKPN